MNRYAPLAVAALLGCDALVGGECADGYAADGDICVPAFATLPTGSGGGSAGMSPAGGAGGTDGPGTGGGTPAGGAPASGGSTGSGPDIAPMCFAGTSRCGSHCVDLESDPLHCGGCNVACSTGLCTEGSCVGSTPGHVVVIGLSYATITGASRHLLGNALFLPMHDPVAVLTLRGAANATASAHVQSTLTIEATNRGRAAENVTVDDAASASDRLVAEPFDILLLHDQPAIDGAAAAADLAPGLGAHLARGGTVVVLAASPNMADLVHDAGLLDLGGVIPITGETLENASPSSALGLHVPSPFYAGESAVSLDLLAGGSDAQVVIRHSASIAPAAVHRTVTTP